MKRIFIKAQSGFSLIELMIVVAIIGILAAVAIPNFLRFQAKSRQSEARANLSAIYSAQKSFRAEWDMYFGDLPETGYFPEGIFRYEHGFSMNVAMTPSNYTGAIGAGSMGAQFNTILIGCGNGVAAAVTKFMGSQTWECGVVRNPAPALPAPALANGSMFTAIAIGNLDDDPVLDYWSVDESKIFRGPHSMAGLPPAVGDGGDLDN